MVILLKIAHFMWNFTKMEVFLVILALFAPRARNPTYLLSYLELFEVPWEPKWWFSPNSTHFSGKSTSDPQSDISHIFSILVISTKDHPSRPKCAAPPSGTESNSSSAKRLVGMGPGWGALRRMTTPARSELVPRAKSAESIPIEQEYSTFQNIISISLSGHPLGIIEHWLE